MRETGWNNLKYQLRIHKYEIVERALRIQETQKDLDVEQRKFVGTLLKKKTLKNKTITLFLEIFT